jgi:hypothetical protein
VLIYAQQTATINPPIAFLAVGAAASLILVEIVYVIKKVISPIYLGDAFVEIVLIVWWVTTLLVA